MSKEDILKILISLMLDMDYADYLEFAEEDLNRCLDDVKFLEENGRQDLLLLLRSLAENHMELLKWYHEHIQTEWEKNDKRNDLNAWLELLTNEIKLAGT